MTTRVLGKYRIKYVKSGIVQYKNLISHKDYVNIVKPFQQVINQLESDKHDKVAKQLKGVMIKMFGDLWFTDQSPLFKAIKTQSLDLLPQQGGSHKCIVEKVKT